MEEPQGDLDGRVQVEINGQDGGGGDAGGNGEITAPVGNWLPQPRLPKFSGKDECVEEFVRESERIITTYNLHNAIGVELLLRTLEGNAREEILELEPEERKTPQQVLDQLRKLFGDRRPRVRLLEDFNNRRQQPGESIMTFCRGLRNLARRYKSAGGTLADVEVRDMFVDRLLNPQIKREMRRTVKKNPHVTLTELKEEAMQWEEEEEDEEDQRSAMQQSHELAAKTTTKSATDLALEKILYTMQSLEQRLGTLEAGQHQPPQHQGPGAIVCYKCRQPGHIRRNCPHNAGKA